MYVCQLLGLLIGNVFNRETEVYFALVKSRTSATTLDSRIRFTNARQISPAAEQDFLHLVTKTIFKSNLSTRLASVDPVIPLSPKLSVDLVKQLAAREENSEAMRVVVAQLNTPKVYSGHSALQQDAFNLALKTFGLSPIASAIYVETENNRETAIQRANVREDAAIEHDARVVPGFTLTGSDLTGRAVFQMGNEQLEVITANRRPLEEVFGVDLIYSQCRKNRTLLWFNIKCWNFMTRILRSTGLYYPDADAQFQEELERMKLFSQSHSPGPLEYRINPQVFYLRFVRRHAMLGRSTVTMPVDHFEVLRHNPENKGPRGCIPHIL